MRFLSFALCSFVLTGMAFGQGANGTITGTITDPSGAIIANAPVEVRNTATGTLVTGVSTATGNYTLPSVPIGTYDLTVAVMGFKTYNRKGLDLAAAQTMRIDIPLEVGANSESVTVTADASLLKTETSAMAQNVTVSQMNNLPILGVGGAGSNASSGFRDPFALAQMLPGTNYGANGIMVINGTPNNNIQVRVDGQVSGNLGGLRQYTAQQQPSVDAIQEVAVQTSNYSAEFGTVGGGIFNASMKSGTNKYSGSAYDYSTNEAINAATPYTGQRSQQHRWDYGFTIGGPVRIPKLYDGTNKTFFFFSFEQFYENLKVKTLTPTVPIPAYRNGDFSQVIIGSGVNGVARNVQVGNANWIDPLGVQTVSGQIFNPATTQTVICNKTATPTSSCVNGQSYLTRSAYLGNIIPASSFDPVALNVLKLVPLPTGANAANGLLGTNYQVPWTSHRVSNLPSIKMDQTTGSKGRLSGYWQSTGTTSQYSFPNGSHDGLPQPIGGARGTFIYAKVIRANYDYTLTPTTLLHLGAGWNSLSFSDEAPVSKINGGYDAVKELGLKGAILNRTFPGFTTAASAATGGMNAIGNPGQANQFERRPSGSVNLSTVKGNHTMKIGAEYRLEKYPVNSFASVSGGYTFGTNINQQTALNGLTTSQGSTGFAFASFLTGDYTSFTLGAPTNAATAKQQWGLFVQDTWKLTRKLTIDLGLRWDYGTYAKEQYGRFSNFDFNTPNPSAGGHPGAQIFEATCKCTFASNYPYALGPRLGAAYQINSKTVFRAGFGVVYTAATIANGSTTNTATTSAAGLGLAIGKLVNGAPASVQPSWPTFTPNIGQSDGAVVAAPVFLDPNVSRPAKQYQWSVGLQREINRNLVVEASYVANRGVWWSAAGLAGNNVLQVKDLQKFGFNDFTSAADSTLLTKTLANLTAADKSNLSARGINLPYSSFPSSQTVRQSILPFPQYTGAISGSGAPLGKTWYDSLQVNVTQRFSHGWSLNGNYTLAKNLDLMGSDDIFNRNNGKDLSGNDVPQQFRVTTEYQVPNFRKSSMKMLSNPVVSGILSNWGLSVFLQYQSAPALARPASAGTLPISNFLGRGPGSAQLKTDPNGDYGYMNPFSVNWTDYSGTVHTDPIDINCHCYDVTKNIVLNKDAWTNIPNGQFSANQSTIRQYRGMRSPQENFNLARNFRIGERVTLHVRAEFQNVMNRMRYLTNAATPAQLVTTTGFTGNPTTFASGANAGLYSGGFGTIVPVTNGTGGARSGTLIGRITF